MTGATPTWNKVLNAGYSVIKTGTGGEDRLAYNQYTGGSWQLTEVSNADFILCHIFATKEKDKPMIAIVGQNEYSNKNQARTGAESEIRELILNDILFPEIRPIATIIFQTRDSYNNTMKARVVSTADDDDYIDWRNEIISRVSIGTTDHNSLTGKQGGTTNEYYHLTSTDYIELNEWLYNVVLGSDGKLTLPNGVAINEFSSDGTLGGDSDLAVPTEKAVKAYIDALGIEDLIDVDFDSGTPADNNVLTYDSASGKWKSEAPAGGITELLEDLTPQLGGDLDLNGKNIDFPSVANISDVKDEDNMASDSATMLATQQSIKKYVDDSIVGISTDNIYDNIFLNAFRIAVNGSLTQFNMVDGVVDEFEDESGVDTGNSTNEDYDSDNNLYQPISGGEYTSDSDTKLLLHCNGIDESPTFTDDGETVHAVTTIADAQIDTAYKKLGTASGLFDGSGDTLSLQNHADFVFGSGNFTIDLWVRWSTVTDSLFLSKRNENGDLQLGWYSGNYGLWFSWSDNSTSKEYYSYTTWTPSQDTWYHIAVVRNDTSIKLYVDGTALSLDHDDGDPGNITNDATYLLYIGCNRGTGYYFPGHLDEIRISSVARWVEDFTPSSGITENMTLISENTEAETQPDDTRIVIFEEDVDAITINTDLKAYASRDNGANWVEATLADEGDYESGKRILIANIDVSGQASDKTMKWKITTHNNKGLKIHGVGNLWS